MIDRLRNLRGRTRPAPSRATSNRRMSRRQREERQRRLAVYGIIAAGVLVVIILGTGALYQYVYLPNKTLASVNSSKISMSEYWKYRKYALINEISQYSQFAQYAQGQNAQQYQSLVDQARAQLQTVEQDPPDADTLNTMVEDQVILQNFTKLGVAMSQQDIDQYLTENFSGVTLGTPSPTPPIDPTAQAWATATANAQATAAAEAAATPGATPGASPTAGTPAPKATPAAAATTAPAVASPAASPSAATPSASPTPTVSAGDAKATATANEQQYEHAVLTQAGMSMNDFINLIVKPDLARQKVDYTLANQVQARQPQVHAEHILVKTQDEANQIEQDLKTQSFEDVAKAKSTDTATAPNGGDLGWFPKGVMVPAFDAVAFSLNAGEVSQPFQTQFGWHIVKVLETDPDRPVLPDVLSQLRSAKTQDWIDSQRKASHIDWNVSSPQPTPTTQNSSNTFTPPADAPPPPAPTPSPAGTPGAGEATPTPAG